jgi:phosphatidylinositol glycan class Z
MWRRTYLLLLLIRVYFALSPSYLHPDEHFQGPEVFAGIIPQPLTLPRFNHRCDALIAPIYALKGATLLAPFVIASESHPTPAHPRIRASHRNRITTTM